MSSQRAESAAGEPVVVRLSGELDAADPSWSDELEAAIARGDDQVVLDLVDVTFIDSSVIRTLVLAHRRASVNGWLRLVYTHHLIRRVVDICGLADVLPQFTTVDAALRDAPTKQHPTDGYAPDPGADVPRPQRNRGRPSTSTSTRGTQP